MPHLTLILFFLTVSSIASAAPWREPVTTYAFERGTRGGELSLAIGDDPKSFNPILAKETTTTEITGHVFEGLTKTDPVSLVVQPLLATDWECDETKTVWTFHLRRDVFFSDGVALTADDVVFTFNELIFNPAIPNSASNVFSVDGKPFLVEKIDDLTVRFTLSSPFAPFLRAMGQEILPKHIYEPFVKAGTFSHAMGLDAKSSQVVGTGPFMLSSYRPGERVVLVRNPRYWKKDVWGQALPYLDRVVFTAIPSSETAMLRFLEGSVDYYGIKPEELAYLASRKVAKDFEIYNGGLTFGSQFVAFNLNAKTGDAQKHALFEDKRFRQAVAYAIDRAQIVNIVLNGLGEPQYGPESPASKVFYSADVARYPYDPTKAKLLLADAGLKDNNGDGRLEFADGKPVRIVLSADAKSSDQVLIASMIRKDLDALGITVDLQPLAFNHLVTKLTATFDWEMVLIGLTGGPEPHFGRNVWHSSGELHLWDPGQKSPKRPWEKRIDDLFDEAVRLPDDADRRKLYGEWQKIASDELPLIYTVLPYSLYAVRNRFGNLFPTVNGGAFWDVEYVYVKKIVRR